MPVDLLNHVLALGGIGMFLGAAILVFDAVTKNWSFAPLFRNYGLWIAGAATLFGSAMTLYYSDVLGYVPCGLCWLERVFLYPQVFILGTALYLKDTKAGIYGMVLSVCGLIISLYHHYLQMGGAELLSCPTTGKGADCAERIIFEFNFVTFPLLAAFLFIFLIALYWYLQKEAQRRVVIE